MSLNNILLIDDDEDDREMFQMAINAVSNAAAFIALDNATEALRKLKDNILQPNVIFLDLNMPKMNGRQFLGRIKKDDELKNIPVFIYSTFSDDETIRELKELGAMDFISKPTELKELVKILKAIVKK